MSLGPLGGVTAGVGGSAAGSPLSQTAGASSERASKDSAAQERAVEADIRTERSSGVGATEGDEKTSDRDADGRRMWERQPGNQDASQDEEQAADERPIAEDEETGGRLDLLG